MLALVLAAGCASQNPLVTSVATLPLPVLPEGPIELRVAHVINPALPRMSDAQLYAMLAIAEQEIQANFGSRVRFRAPEVVRIEDVFMRFVPDLRAELDKLIFDFKNGSGNRGLLVETFTRDLRDTGNDLNDMIAYAEPFLVEKPQARTYEALAEALVKTQLTRLDAWKSQKTADGRPLIDSMPYNEFIYWDAVQQIAFPYEVIITNQLIASTEYANSSVHSALRGGISNGITSPNSAARFGTTSLVSTYPFIGNDAWTRELREGETYSDAEAARFAGYLLVHEIGHQLFHLGHPFGAYACVMNPVQLLRFRSWVRQMSAADCPLGSEGAMKPGFAKFPPPPL